MPASSARPTNQHCKWNTEFCWLHEFSRTGPCWPEGGRSSASLQLEETLAQTQETELASRLEGGGEPSLKGRKEKGRKKLSVIAKYRKKKGERDDKL